MKTRSVRNLPVRRLKGARRSSHAAARLLLLQLQKQLERRTGELTSRWNAVGVRWVLAHYRKLAG